MRKKVGTCKWCKVKMEVIQRGRRIKNPCPRIVKCPKCKCVENWNPETF